MPESRILGGVMSAFARVVCLAGAYATAALLATRVPLVAQGPPPAFLIPCGIPGGAAPGGPRGGLPPGGGPPPGLPFAGGSPPGVAPAVPRLAEGAPQDRARPALPAGVRLTPVQGSVYMLSGAGGNITVQVGSEGALIVDTGRADRAEAVIAAIRQLTALPLRFILNTAADVDHTGGNETVGRFGRRLTTAFGRAGGDTPGAAIIARQAVQNRMVADKASECALPTATYDVFPTRTMFFNGEGIVLQHAPAAHSDGDSLVFFRRSDVVSAGDIFNTDLYPVIDVEHGGSIEGTIAALNAVLEITIPALKEEGGTFVVPGHGRIADEADVSEYRDMVTIVRDRVRALVAKKMTLEQVKAAKPTLDFDGRYGSTQGPTTTNRFIEAVYRGLSQQAASSPAARRQQR